MIKSIKTKELQAQIQSWENRADGLLDSHKIESNWDNYYCGAGLLTAAEDLKELIRNGYFNTGDKD